MAYIRDFTVPEAVKTIKNWADPDHIPVLLTMSTAQEQ